MTLRELPWLALTTFGTFAGLLALLSGPGGWFGVCGTLAAVHGMRCLNAAADAAWEAEKASWKRGG